VKFIVGLAKYYPYLTVFLGVIAIINDHLRSRSDLNQKSDKSLFKIRLKPNEVITDFGACRKNVLYETLSPLLGVEMRFKQKKIDPTLSDSICRRIEENDRFVPRELFF